MNRTLTVDGYIAARYCDPDIDKWLEENDLHNLCAFRAQFGEGMIRLRCYLRIDGTDKFLRVNGVFVDQVRELPLRTPPPPIIYDYLEDVPL